MSGFNRILKIQPRQSTQVLHQPSIQSTSGSTTATTLSVRTPLSRLPVRPIPLTSSKTPMKRPSTMISQVNAPIKKRYIGAQRYIPSPSLIEDEDEIAEEEFPGNQQGFHDGGFGSLDVEEIESQMVDVEKEKAVDVESKKVFTKVTEESIESGGFIIPSEQQKQLQPSFHWLAGRADGQYRVVLGYNTLFKPKNAVDATTGEKTENNRWRVVRFENRYKENFPYAEFPVKYIEPIIQALTKAREKHEEETLTEEL